MSANIAKPAVNTRLPPAAGTDGLLSVKCVLGSLWPFVHWSFVAPNIFGVRMIMVPPHARFAVVSIAFWTGFAGGLTGTLSF